MRRREENEPELLDEEDDRYLEALGGETTRVRSRRRYVPRGTVMAELMEEVKRQQNPFAFLEAWNKELNTMLRFLFYIKASFGPIEDITEKASQVVKWSTPVSPSVAFAFCKKLGLSEAEIWRALSLGPPVTWKDLYLATVVMSSDDERTVERALRNMGSGLRFALFIRGIIARRAHLVAQRGGRAQVQLLLKSVERAREFAKELLIARAQRFYERSRLTGYGWVYGADAVGYLVGAVRNWALAARNAVTMLGDELNLPADMTVVIDNLAQASEDVLTVLFDPDYPDDYDAATFSLNADEGDRFVVEEVCIENSQIVKIGDPVCVIRGTASRKRRTVKYEVTGAEDVEHLPVIVLVYEVHIEEGDIVENGDPLFSFVMKKKMVHRGVWNQVVERFEKALYAARNELLLLMEELRTKLDMITVHGIEIAPLVGIPPSPELPPELRKGLVKARRGEAGE